jgi:hypothetical protein
VDSRWPDDDVSDLLGKALPRVGSVQTLRMADTLRAFDGEFASDAWPAATCPTCKQGDLHVSRVDDDRPSMTTVLTGEAARERRDHPGWDPDWMVGRFHGVLVCPRPQCDERVIVAGDFRTGASTDPTEQYQDYYRLRFTWPAIPLMIPPAATPQSVVDRLDEASRVVWADPASAANALRRCVEAVLDHQKVNKTAQKQSGGRRPLSTHERILALKAKDELAARSLEAVKWVGNQGSHGGDSITASNVVESGEYLGHALRRLYDRTDEVLARKAAAVNKRKGIKNRP